ncbi:dTDP-4-dehydrorhamnose 3,5-epimerase [Paenibacillus thiaminolyticus]|uniref:dTDP-4-dehydrorhamnose 3,5-epimerase n=1 Tax=Paenibacillus thiaminolyticus TaxID=49283 RepID=UPI001163B4AE|nr:dTDP-4-dehydrorhamnose 3,5-epimerase [Paenibacillus thiaminolyticus]NGP58363.1 dTDP-4-dehydrorhamnose 3,5-epimerase [Paenibacillus thiaminolyticus]WCR26585.1 dTDP-4-dehydrorhamnose 3,5-epimerase [Paenibacillus thiaminolyticus]
MKIMSTPLDGVVMLEPQVFEDERGFFMESYHLEKWEASGIPQTFVQDNHSLSARAGTIRGLHYQLEPMAQTKLVRVLAGAIYDVAVDIRRGSPRFGQWIGVILSAANKRQLLIPPGYAHGFCSLVDDTEVMYKVDAHYAPEWDRGIRWDDPALGIPWPASNLIMSEKDKALPLLEHAETFFLSSPERGG